MQQDVHFHSIIWGCTLVVGLVRNILIWILGFALILDNMLFLVSMISFQNHTIWQHVVFVSDNEILFSVVIYFFITFSEGVCLVGGCYHIVS